MRTPTSHRQKPRSRYGRVRRVAVATASMFALVFGFQVVMAPEPAEAANCTSSMYRQGSSGTCVRHIQTIVNASGVSAKITVDGIWGPKTTTGVKAFQKNRKIAQDAIVGPNTWKALCAVTQNAAKTAQSSAACKATASTPPKTTTPANQYHCNISSVIKTAPNSRSFKVTTTVTNTSGSGWAGSQSLRVSWISRDGKTLGSGSHVVAPLANGKSKVVQASFLYGGTPDWTAGGVTLRAEMQNGGKAMVGSRCTAPVKL